jgi:restriction endonuclease Mrr
MTPSDALPSQLLIKAAMLEVLKESKGGLHIRDIEEAVATRLSLTKSQRELMHKGKRTLLGYKLAWARTAAKKEGLIESPRSSVWKIVD